MKKVLLSFACFTAMFNVNAQNCTEVFISEYVEGLGNNKAIEIYNPTASSIDMSQYFLQRYSNGSTTASLANAASEAKTVQLMGTIAPYSTLVYVIDLRNPNGTGQTAPIWSELEAKGDFFLCPTYSVNNVMYFNGNDAMLLGKGPVTTMQGQAPIDVIGKIGENPELTSGGTKNGWTTIAPYNGTSTNPADKVVTEDHSLIRKSSVKGGWVGQGVFQATWNPLEQWDSIPARIPKTDSLGNIIFQSNGTTPQWVGNWESLGWHTCDCAPLSVDGMNLDNISLFPNPTTGKFTISGLTNVASIQVVNTLGQVVYTVTENIDTTVSFDLSEKSGIYMVTIKDKAGRSATQKVIVK